MLKHIKETLAVVSLVFIAGSILICALQFLIYLINLVK